MRASLNWIKEFVDIDGVDIDEIAKRLTMSGLEVEGIERREKVENVVTARVLKKEKHPNADKLSVCRVFDGQQEYQVVCGASNVKEGQIVPFARSGAKLARGVNIRDTKIRGVESKGMICSAEELGLEEASDGILELPDHTDLGLDVNNLLGIEDVIFELNITPNRADCLSILGIAREIALLFDKDVKIRDISITEDEERVERYRYVKVENETDCPIYLGRIIRGVKVEESPLWMQNRLKSAGIRPINNIVDITNYVMLEYGQPLHAFDLRMVEGGIIVRNAKEGEKILTLDGKERELKSNMLVIADEKKVLAVAGVMGGEYSGIQNDTADVFLECAYFRPESIRMTARRLGMKTDSSYRYERGVDRVQTIKMVDYAAGLIKQLAWGVVLKGVLKNNYQEYVPKRFKFSWRKVVDYLGLNLEESDVMNILKKIGIVVESGEIAIVPSYRQDIERWQDLSEEVARIYGYDNIPVTIPKIYAYSDEENILQRLGREIKNILSDLGYNEVINYSFMSGEFLKRFAEEKDFVRVKNPISADMDTMRSVVFPGLLKSMVTNYNSGVKQLKLFEVANVHRISNSNRLPEERMKCAFGVLGDFYGKNWIGKLESDLFYYLKATLESIVKRYKLECEYERTSEHFLHPGKGADIIVNNTKIGFLGEVHPEVYQYLDVDEKIYICEIDLVVLAELISNAQKRYKKLSQYPYVYKDIAVVVDKEVQSIKLYNVISRYSELIKDVEIFDRYEGEKIGKDKVSLAFRIYFNHHEKTLTDEETNEMIRDLVDKLGKEFGAVLR